MEVIKATLPLTPENQIKYFKNKDILFQIDVENSKITSKQCLMTLSNMRIKAEIKAVSPELLNEYMQGRFVVETTNLPKIMANVLFGYRYGVLHYSDVTDYFSIDAYAEFIVEHQETLQKWSDILDAIPLYLVMCSQGFVSSEFLTELKSKVEVVEGEIEGVGVNISQVVSLPYFLSAFLDKEGVKSSLALPYYQHYFDEYIYSGKKLLSFLVSPEYKSEFAVDAFSLMRAFSENKVERILER